MIVLARRRAGDRQRRRHRRGIDVLEIGDVDGIADGLVGIAEIDGRGGLQDQRVGAGAAVDRSFGAVVGDGVVAGTRPKACPRRRAPSMVSLPAPPVMMLAPDEPVIDTAAETADASTFWKLLIVPAPNDNWLALARFSTTEVFRISVLVPVPPSTEVSVP